MMKRRNSRWIGLTVGLLAIPLFALSEPQKTEVSTVNSVQQIAEVRQEMMTVMQLRDEAVQEFSTRYQNAALDQRVSLEQEGAIMENGYELQYLTLAVEYYRLQGNTLEMQKAQERLSLMNQTEQRLPDAKKQELARHQMQSEQNSAKEGVTTDAK